MVSDDENNQAVTNEAFEVLHFIAAKRLALGRLTVIDATNVQPEARKPLVELARQYHCLPVAIVLDLPERSARSATPAGPTGTSARTSSASSSRNCAGRSGGSSGRASATSSCWRRPRRSRRPSSSGCRSGTTSGTSTARSTSSATFTAAATSWRPCCEQLGYADGPADRDDPLWGGRIYAHPEGRKAVFVGDLVDRGPRILDTVRLVRNMVAARLGPVRARQPRHEAAARSSGARTSRSRTAWPTRWPRSTPCRTRSGGRSASELAEFLDGLVSHYVLDDGKLVVAHAGMKEEMQGRGSGKVRDFALYGETTGETDEFGLPVRYNWAAEYRGQAMVVYGHTPVPEPDWLNRTVNIDTGCVFGGKLTALRYPEKEFVSVPAARTYCEPARPFLPAEQQAPGLTAQQAHDDVLDAEDVLGKRIIPTRLRGNVTIREENATAALEVMSRFAANPKWLIYLPPTMSPCETSRASRACWSTRPRRSPTTAARASRRSSARRSTWARGPSSSSAGTSRRPGSGSALPTGRDRHRLHPHRPAVLQRPRTWSGSSSTGCGRR